MPRKTTRWRTWRQRQGRGPHLIILAWRPPANGSPPGVYKIQRKQEGQSWEDLGISTDTDQLCSNQPRGVELFYRVIAANKAGAGQPSATVSVVL